jgi:hypothetical protein
MRNAIEEPWSVFACAPVHVQATDQLGLADKRLFFPYGLIEGEPTFPLSNYTPQALADRLASLATTAFPRGTMANCQTHCLQLAHTYLFAHLARGGTLASADLENFAEKVLPGSGATIARAWQSVEIADPDSQRRAAEAVRRRIGLLHPLGPCAGLLLGDGDRFLADLAMNLDVRAGLSELSAASAAGRDIKPALGRLLSDLIPYQRRLGFVDAYYGALYDGLNEPLKKAGNPRIDAALLDFYNWQEPQLRNGALKRLLDAAEAYQQTR